MPKKLFVGNLSWNTRDESLFEAFAQFGEVSDAKVIFDRETGRSRGFGFVTFAEEQAGQDAMSAMDGQELDGRPIRVNEAQERRNGGGFRGDRW
jgi:RNA recognition motif-containing protein